MIESISIWTKQIIIAVIIASIIELITPSGKNKKYIKMVIGFYILFIIISPVASKFTGENISVSSFEYEKYFNNINSNQDNNLSNELERNNNEIIKNTYIANLKQDIENKIDAKGFVVSDIDVEIDTSEEDYGTILKLDMKVSPKQSKDNISTANNITINKIEIGNEVIENEETNRISNSEKNEIIDFLSEEYEISKDKINIKTNDD